MTIKATIIADSVYNGKRLTTFELEYPRFIHAELMTHRLFSRNAASSRAIPVKTTARQIKDDPEMPIVWGKNISGMQSEGELSAWKMYLAGIIWRGTAKMAATSSIMLAKLGLHKQWANRVAEWAQTYKVIVTSTDFENFFHLRYHDDAQPEIRQLAAQMYNELLIKRPNQLKEGEWHLPYIHTTKDCLGNLIYLSKPVKDLDISDPDCNKTRVLPSLSLEDAQKISVSSCAQVSYRKLDTSIDKAKKIFDMLISADVIHASPFEHVATPITDKYSPTLGIKDWQEGVTHVDKDGEFWSGNFKGWIQYRHLIKNNTCTRFEK